jgi:hypothetical protein
MFSQNSGSECVNFIYICWFESAYRQEVRYVMLHVALCRIVE